MDLLIPNSWLKKYLDTKATPIEIAKYLSLCGPSIERIKKSSDGDCIYSIEVTTNRVDTASIVGIAREAQTILPRFGIKAKFINQVIEVRKHKFVGSVKYLDVTNDPNLCPRFTAVLIKNVKIADSPKEISSLLEKVGVRPINNIVDVSNYIMHEIGQPVHTFDYDKIAGAKMILRQSRKGEEIETLDGKKFTLPGEDIVIEDGEGNLIDLCGIMGGEASAIDKDTENVLLFVQNYNRHKIRKTSMTLAQRSEAAVLFEKGLDPELVKPSILKAVEMIEKLSGGKSVTEILDIYPNPYKEKCIKTDIDALNKIIGIKLSKKDISQYLESLGFTTSWSSNNLIVKVPSFRSNDVDIPEDIAEEIARIYGYHNLPNILMEGALPKPSINNRFKFEATIKQTLKSLGGIEIYNLSLVSKSLAGEKALRLANSMGADTEYLRTSLMTSLIKDVLDNHQEKDKIHFFEMANVYIAQKDSLPNEKLMLAGIIKGGEYRENKGCIETLLLELNISFETKVEDGGKFLPNQKLTVYSDRTKIGEYGNLDNGLFYYEFEADKLTASSHKKQSFIPIPKYPAQIEDITLILPAKTKVGDIINSILPINRLIGNVELIDIYKNAYTFRIWYQDINKTLTDDEVEKVRKEIIAVVKSKFRASVKE